MAETDALEVSRVSFRFQYAGSALEAGLMDVRDLAPALLSLGNLCEQEAKRAAMSKLEGLFPAASHERYEGQSKGTERESSVA